MNAEFIAVLEHLEREKGVSRTVLLQAVAAALSSAARKVVREKESNIEVQIDSITGDIKVTSDGEPVKSKEFGRIAAQTAKQVIIQKIREAERDAVFTEFHTRVNSMLSGTVYRFDKGAVILDMGKTEAVLPKREQSPRDSFRQGDRVRAFVLEVSKSAKGPQIVVSRSNPGLVKKLFEVEVPEVLEGIVEIKAVARDAGDRSKIAVWSKDEKVDCVGACVGMRGLRVKNVVRELQGEKIDIVRWSEDIVEYVKGALSPAQCTQIAIKNREEKRIEAILDEDQLSLAIGKNGQNVRLAAKLTGWMIDIQSKKDVAKALLDGGSETVALSEVEGVGKKGQESLIKAGIETANKLAETSIEDLKKIEGIGEKTAEKMLKAAKDCLVELASKKAETDSEVSGSTAELPPEGATPETKEASEQEAPKQENVEQESKGDEEREAKESN